MSENEEKTEGKFDGTETNWTVSAGLVASLMGTAAALSMTPTDVATALGGPVASYNGGYADATQRIVSYALATGKVLPGQGPESLAVAFVAKVWHMGVEWHPTFRFGITDEEVVRFIRTMEFTTRTLLDREDWSFKAPRSKPAPKPAARKPTASVTPSTKLEEDEFLMTHFSRHVKDDKTTWRAWGGRLTKHGVVVWPEVAVQVNTLMGINLEAMKAGHKYPMDKFGIIAHYIRKEPTDEYPQGAISKVDAFRAGAESKNV